MKKYFLLSIGCLITFLVHAMGDPPQAVDVFSVAVKKVDSNNFVIDWQIKANYFLYRKSIRLMPPADGLVHLGDLRLPFAQKKRDKQGEISYIYRNDLSVPVGVLANKPGESLVYLHYQGCADDGFCYPPEVRAIQLSVDNNLALTKAILYKEPQQEVSSGTQTEAIHQIFADHGWAMILLIFFGFGLLLSFTPCILPMIPVLSGIIVGHGKTVTTRKAFFLSLSYVLSMSVTYAFFGAMVALLGFNLQISMQSPWAIGLLSLIFILLALSMFGFYEFKLPDSWQAKISGSSRTQRGGHYWGAAIMGSLSTLVLSPCVTAPLIGVLTYIMQTQNVLLGGLTLFFLSLGMGTPLLLIGTSAGKYLPQSGSWMIAVKAFFGILLVAVAIYLLQRIVPSNLVMIAWACLLVFSGIYAGAFSFSLTNREKFFQGVGILLLSYGLLILVGISLGSTNPLQPLAKLVSIKEVAMEEVIPQQTLDSITGAIAESKGQPVMLEFYADWCASCKIMEATVFKNPQVQEALRTFKVIKIDVSANNTNNQSIMSHFKVVAPPTFLFFNRRGKEVVQLKLVGESTTKEFLMTLKHHSLEI